MGKKPGTLWTCKLQGGPVSSRSDQSAMEMVQSSQENGQDWEANWRGQ